MSVTAVALPVAERGRLVRYAKLLAWSSLVWMTAEGVIAVVAGLLGNTVLGWWWLDPVAALFIAFVALREGREAWRGEGVPLVRFRSDRPRHRALPSRVRVKAEALPEAKTAEHTVLPVGMVAATRGAGAQRRPFERGVLDLDAGGQLQPPPTGTGDQTFGLLPAADRAAEI